MEDTKIFISYAHDDEAYFKVFQKGIEKHSKKLKWGIWTDKKIPVGALWHEVIQEEIQNSDAAILLVSANFLSSDYIENQEFSNFLKKSEDDGFTFLPILLSDCDITQWEKLSERQFFLPKGSDYGIHDKKELPYSYLCKFSENNQLIPNAYRDTYHKDCVIAFEQAIKSRKKKTLKNENQENTNPSQKLMEELSQFQEQIKKHISEQDDKINTLADSIDFLINAAYKRLKPIRNYSLIRFNKEQRKYFFEFEKQLEITETKDLLKKYETQFYANKHPEDEKAMRQFYKKNKIFWEDLNVKATISIFEDNLKKWTDEKEVHVIEKQEAGNYIPFTIDFKTKDRSGLPLIKGNIVKIKYRYNVPVSLWGSFINRHLSYYKEPLIVDLRYETDNPDLDLINEISVLLPPKGTPSECPAAKYKITNSYNENEKTIRIEFEGNRFEKFRITWFSDFYFGEDATPNVEDASGYTSR